MKYFKNIKGSYGYINKQKIRETIRTIIYFAFAVGLYLIGYLTLKTNKNLFTILAVLSVLPAAKCAVSMIMFFRFSSISKEEFDLIEKEKGNIPVIYELVFTTNETAYYIKSAACCENTIIALYNENSKKNNTNEIKNYILTALDRDGINGCSVKIFVNTTEYIRRLKEMNDNLDSKNDNSSSKVFALFKAITL